MKNKNLKILLASPRGFCAGVDRAIEIVKKSIDKYGSPVYVRHEIVHNKHVVDSLKKIVIASSESCTGGMLSSAITDIPGSSAIFECGFVTYSNISKMKLLNVHQITLETYDHDDISMPSHVSKVTP